MNIRKAFDRLVASGTEIGLFATLLVAACWLMWWQNNRVDASTRRQQRRSWERSSVVRYSCSGTGSID